MAGQYPNYQQATPYSQTYQSQQPRVNVYQVHTPEQQAQLHNSSTPQLYQQGPYSQFSYPPSQQSAASQPFHQPQYSPSGYPVHQQAQPAYPILPSVQQQQSNILQGYRQQSYTPHGQYGWPSVNAQAQQTYSLNNPQNTSQQPQTSYGQSHLQGCFNCGHSGHWAQACPEPKRQVPAGTLNPAQHRRQGIAPPKRNSQIITKFSPHAISAQGSPLSAPSTFPTPGSWHYTAPRAPATPQPVLSPAQSWSTSHHQNGQNPYNHLAAQACHQVPTTMQNQYPDTPASVPSQDLAPSKQSSPTPPLQRRGSQSTHELLSQHSSPLHQLSEAVHKHGGQFDRIHDVIKEPSGQQGQYTGIGPIHMWSPSSNPYKDAVDTEVEDDDLDLLDIPEGTPNDQESGSVLISSIGMPIPSNFVVADALFPMMPPSASDGGLCRSKYSRDLKKDGLSFNIVDSKYWKEHEDDTIFMDLLATDEVVTLEECRARIWERRRPPESQRRKSRSESESVLPAKRDVTECAESLAQLERALADAKAKQAEMIANLERKRGSKRPCQEISDHEYKASPTTEQPSPSSAINTGNKNAQSRQSEDGLSSLGETGTIKATKQTGQACQKDLQNSPTNHRLRVKSVTSHDRSSHHIHDTTKLKNQLLGHQTDDFKNLQQPAAQQLPQPQRQSSSAPDRTTGSSPHTTEFDHFGDPIVGHPNPCSHKPSQMTGFNSHPQDHSLLQQKRNYHSRESSSDDSDAPARRQEDDVSFRLKRRKPQVEEAYSRRW